MPPFHQKTKHVILAGVILLAVSGVALYRIYHSPSSTILETRTFSCPGMSGFTFQYPVFKGWEVLGFGSESLYDENGCAMYLSFQAYKEGKVLFEIAPQIQVSKTDHTDKTVSTSRAWYDWFFGLIGGRVHREGYFINPSRITYVPLSDSEYIFTYDHDTDIKISLTGVPDEYGFSRDVFWKTVAESFTVIPGSADSVQPVTHPAKSPVPADYQVATKDIYHDTPARVNFSDKPFFRTWITLITEGAKQGPNFGGHYTIVQHGCGSNCQFNTVINAITGKIIGDVASEFGTEFDLHSRLLVVNPPDESIKDGFRTDIVTQFYEIKDDILTLVYSENTNRLLHQRDNQ